MSAANKIRAWFCERKDSSVTFILERLIRPRLEPYGQLLELQLDSQENSVRARVLLNGEAEPITVWVEKYAVQEGPEGLSIQVQRARASREWISRLIQDFLVGRSFPIPEKYASATKMVL